MIQMAHEKKLERICIYQTEDKYENKHWENYGKTQKQVNIFNNSSTIIHRIVNKEISENIDETRKMYNTLKNGLLGKERNTKRDKDIRK